MHPYLLMLYASLSVGEDVNACYRISRGECRDACVLKVEPLSYFNSLMQLPSK